MKKDIKLLQIEIQNDKQMFEDYGERVHFDNNIVSAIENLINKYKEQEKVIELMAKFINNIDIDEDICKVMGEKPYCDEYYNANNCIKCVIEYYEKKARE